MRCCGTDPPQMTALMNTQAALPSLEPLPEATTSWACLVIVLTLLESMQPMLQALQ